MIFEFGKMGDIRLHVHVCRFELFLSLHISFKFNLGICETDFNSNVSQKRVHANAADPISQCKMDKCDYFLSSFVHFFVVILCLFFI